MRLPEDSNWDEKRDLVRVRLAYKEVNFPTTRPQDLVGLVLIRKDRRPLLIRGA